MIIWLFSAKKLVLDSGGTCVPLIGMYLTGAEIFKSCLLKIVSLFCVLPITVERILMPFLPVSTPAPLNLSDQDILRGQVSAKNPLQPTIANYEILLADLIFLQQAWVVPRKTASGLAILPLETSTPRL